MAGLPSRRFPLFSLSPLPLAVLLTAAPAVFSNAWATDSAEAVEMTVTAPAPSGVPQAQASTAATVIGAQEMEDAQARRLQDLLPLVPGVSQRGGHPGQPTAFSIRGLGPRNTRVFLDGIEISDTSQAQAQYTLGEMTIGDLESVEVLRGPQPGRFGANAGGGVLNLTSKRASRPFGGEVGAEYGSFNTRRAHGSVEGIQGPVDFRFGLSGTATDGISDFAESRGGIDEDPYRQWSASGRLGVKITDDLRLDAVGRYQREDLAYDNPPTGEADWTRDESERAGRLSATLDTLDDRLIHTLGIADSLTTRQYWGAGTAGDTYDGGKTRVDYLGRFAVVPGVDLEFGADAARERVDIHSPGFTPLTPNLKESAWNRGGFLTAGVTPLHGLDLTATLRGDSHDNFGEEATWRTGAAYTVAATETTLHASYGTAWQTPSLYERFDPCYGNAALNPEKSKGWDAGVSQNLLGGRLTAGATYFQAKTDDEIAWQWAPATNAACWGGGYVNLNRTRVQGIETEITARPVPDVELRLSHTWQNAVNDLTDERLRDRPLHQAGAGVAWRFLPGAVADVGLRYRDNTVGWGGRSDEFWTADLRLAYAVTEALTLHGRIENLFDAEYEEEEGSGTAGIAGYAGATYRF